MKKEISTPIIIGIIAVIVIVVGLLIYKGSDKKDTMSPLPGQPGAAPAVTPHGNMKTSGPAPSAPAPGK